MFQGGSIQVESIIVVVLLYFFFFGLYTLSSSVVFFILYTCSLSLCTTGKIHNKSIIYSCIIAFPFSGTAILHFLLILLIILLAYYCNYTHN